MAEGVDVNKLPQIFKFLNLSPFWGFDVHEVKNLNLHLASKLIFICNNFFKEDFSRIKDQLHESKKSCITTVDHVLYQTFLNCTNYRCVYGADTVEDGKVSYTDNLGELEIFQTGSIGDGLLTVSSDIDIMVSFNKYIATDQVGCQHSHDENVIVLEKGTTDAFVYIPENHIMNKIVSAESNDVFERHGPALMQVIKEDNHLRGDVEVEVTCCIPLKDWPTVSHQWFSRSRSDWPNSDIVKECSQSKCYIVAKHYPGNDSNTNEWRYSMSVTERILSRSFSERQRETYIVAKFILKTNVLREGGLSSYHLKTAMFWLCEEIPMKSWEEKTITERVVMLISKLMDCLLQVNLPNFFIPTSNIISHLTQDTIQGAVSKIREILSNVKASLIMKKIQGMPRSLKLPFEIGQLTLWKDTGTEKEQLILERIYCNYLYWALLNLANNMFDDAMKSLQEVPCITEYQQSEATTAFTACNKNCKECQHISSINESSFITINTLISLAIGEQEPYSFSAYSDINLACEAFANTVMVLFLKTEHAKLLERLISSVKQITVDDTKVVLFCHLFLQVTNHSNYMINQNLSIYNEERDKLFEILHCVQEQLQFTLVHKSILAAWATYRSKLKEKVTIAYYKRYNLDANILIISSVLNACLHMMRDSDPNNFQYYNLRSAVLIILSNETNAAKESLYFGVSLFTCFVVMAQDFEGLKKLVAMINDLSKWNGEEGKKLLLPILTELVKFVQNPLISSEKCIDQLAKSASSLSIATGSLEYLKEYCQHVSDQSGLPYLYATIAELMASEQAFSLAKQLIEESFVLLEEIQETPPESMVALHKEVSQKS